MPGNKHDCSSVKLLTWAESGESVSLGIELALGFTGAMLTMVPQILLVVDCLCLVLQMGTVMPEAFLRIGNPPSAFRFLAC